MKAHVSMSHGSPALLLVMIFLCCIESMVQATTSQLEVRQLLKRLNKPAIKTIKVCYSTILLFILFFIFFWFSRFKKIFFVHFERVLTRFSELFFNKN